MIRMGCRIVLQEALEPGRVGASTQVVRDALPPDAGEDGGLNPLLQRDLLLRLFGTRVQSLELVPLLLEDQRGAG